MVSAADVARYASATLLAVGLGAGPFGPALAAGEGGAGKGAADTEIRAIDVSPVGAGLRLTLQADSALRASLLALRNPDRLVLDLDGVALGEVLASLPARIADAHPLIRGIQVSRVRGQGARVVIDLQAEADASLSAGRDEGKHQWVLTLWPHGAPGAPGSPAVAGLQQAASVLVTPEIRTPLSAPQAAAAAPREAAATAPREAPAAAPSQAPVTAPPSTVTPPAAMARPEAPAGLPAGTVEELLFEIRLPPARTLPPQLVLRSAERGLLIRREALRALRLRVPEAEPLVHDGEAFDALDGLRGLSYRVDEPTQALLLDAQPGLFESTMLAGTQAGLAEPAPAPLGGFFNYDLNASRTSGDTVTSGYFELGAFGPLGSGISAFVSRERFGQRELVRLDSTWTYDMPARLASLRVGDAISGSGQWGRAVRFAGLQWATNFGTQPGLVTFPQPGIAGEAVLSSTVDLYINDTLRLRRQVPEGPFSIQDLPVITGSGEARLVVRDILGRERIITQPYYASPRLLREGLQAHSYEIGFIRENYGLESADYGRFMTAATWRTGLSDRLTAELRGELLADQRTLGLAGAWLLPSVGLLSGAVAASDSDRGRGGLLSVGFERQGRGFGFGANVQAASESFAQLGQQPGELASRSRIQAYLSYAAAGAGSFGLGYTRQDHRDRDDVELLNLSYSLSLGRIGFVNLSLLRLMGDEGSTVFGISYTRPLEKATSLGANASLRSGANQASVQMQRSLPAGSGYGYRLRAAGGASESVEAGLSLQNDVSTWQLEAARRGDATGLRVGVAGGVVLIGGEVAASRTVSDSFALVRVPGFPGVQVYADNQPVARTDGDGMALVPRVRAYERNRLRIEQADLPLDAEVGALSAEAVPRHRSGVVVEFPVRRVRGATLTIRLDDGSPLPAGAQARVASFVAILAALCGPGAAVAQCSVSTVGVAFGSYDVFHNAPLDSAGTVTVDCAASVPYTVAISTGMSGTFVARTMLNGPNALQYNLYLDAARVTIWGDGNGGSSALGGTGTGLPVQHTVYGRVPARQNVRAGAYVDSLTVTVSF